MRGRKYNALLCVLFLIASLALPSPGNASALQLRKGAGVHTWLNWSPVREDGSRRYAWPPYRHDPAPVTRQDFEFLKRSGFDFVRLSIDPGPVLSVSGAKRKQALDILGNAVRLVLATGLNVVWDYHPVGQVPLYSAKSLEVAPDHPLARNYRAMIGETAAMLQAIAPGRTALELMNEPQFYPCDGGGGRQWQQVLESLVTAARAHAPDLTLIVSGACGGGIKGLVNLDPSSLKQDENLLYSFHYYLPYAFTHQGTGEWRYMTHVPWPASRGSLAQAMAGVDRRLEDAGNLGRAQKRAYRDSAGTTLSEYFAANPGEQTVRQDFDRLLGWAAKHGIAPDRLLLGEFGAYPATGSRAGAAASDLFRWLSFLRGLAEHNKMGWSVWEYGGEDMSIVTAGRERMLRPGIAVALDLQPAENRPVGQ